MKKYPAVFFDRDGVLNQAIIKEGKPYPPRTMAEFVIAADAQAAAQTLKEKGFKLFLFTNQPDVVRGKTDKNFVENINQYLQKMLALDECYTCYHDDVDDCQCRKPKPGLIFTAAIEHGIDLQNSFVIGDRWRDIDAGKAANCRTIWLKNTYDEKKPTDMNYSAKSLMDAVQWILKF